MFVRNIRYAFFVIVILALLPLASLATASQPEYSLTLVREGQPTQNADGPLPRTFDPLTMYVRP